MSQPLISVLVPAYNHAPYIEEAVQSIWEQSYPCIEIILIDDGSADATFELARAMQARSPIPMQVATQSNQGINKTLNKALRLAKGELVALVASDDMFAPRRFEKQVAMFSANPHLKIVYGNGVSLENGKTGREVHDSAVKKLLNSPPQAILQYLYTNISPLFIQTCLIKRSFLELIGGFDERVLADDWVLNIRVFRNLKKKEEFGFVDEVLFLYRQHGRNSHKNMEAQTRRILEVIEQYTPVEHRGAFLAKVHYNFAMQAAAAKNFSKAFQHLKFSQQARLDPLRLAMFACKSIVYPVKKAIRKLDSE